MKGKELRRCYRCGLMKLISPLEKYCAKCYNNMEFLRKKTEQISTPEYQEGLKKKLAGLKWFKV